VLAYYAQIKWVHVVAVLLSGGVFLARGLLVQAGRTRWAMASPTRYASYGIDTVLLVSALLLVLALPGALFANAWLTVKVALVILYIGLGTAALKRAPTRRGRALSLVAALAVYVVVIGIALAHHPMGWLVLLRS
jgi:uncharacterized membrane protein SirB2